MKFDLTNATVLELAVVNNPDKVVAHACGACRIVAINEQAARECCAPRFCDCGQKLDSKFKTHCNSCGLAQTAAREQKLYDEAKKISYKQYDGTWLFCDCCHDFFEDLDCLFDSHANYEREVPDWAWGTHGQKLELSAEQIVEGALEEHHEDAWDSIDGVDELQKTLDAWCEKQSVVSYFVDHTTVVTFEEEAQAVSDTLDN